MLNPTRDLPLCSQALYRLSNPVAVTKDALATNPARVKKGAEVASESSVAGVPVEPFSNPGIFSWFHEQNSVESQ